MGRKRMVEAGEAGQLLAVFISWGVLGVVVGYIWSAYQENNE